MFLLLKFVFFDCGNFITPMPKNSSSEFCLVGCFPAGHEANSSACANRGAAVDFSTAFPVCSHCKSLCLAPQALCEYSLLFFF